MEVFKRKSGELLKIKHKLDDGATNKFVRAFLTDKNGTPVAPTYSDLTHIANGVYSEGALFMPNIDQLVVSIAVFTDFTYTVKDPAYTEDCDLYELDSLDISNLIPPPARVEMGFKKPQIQIKVIQEQIIEGEVND